MSRATESPKIALVTGANKGIGYAIAKGLGEQGLKVWIGARDTSRGLHAAEQLRKEGIDAHFVSLDVTNEASVKAAARRVMEESGQLDVLINNAGIILGAGTSPLDQTVDEVKAVYEVNVFGVIRVTQAFVPALRASPGARVVIVSSGLGSLSLVTDPASIYSTANLLAYNTSKTAVNAVGVSLAKALDPYGIKVNMIEPGNVATDLNGFQGALTPSQGAIAAVRLATLAGDSTSGCFYGHEGIQPW